MSIIFNCFKDGKPGALTFSYDDGKLEDIRLVELFNKHGVKGTFNLNSRLWDDESKVHADQIASLYKGHEVAVHGQRHLFPSFAAKESLVHEFWDDRKVLESIVGYPVRGSAYAYGDYNEQAICLLQNLGIEYARTVNSTQNFYLPKNFMEWHPTCHHVGALELVDAFNKAVNGYKHARMQLFYVWGHSYEFERSPQSWSIIEEFLDKMSGREDVWYATNIEIKRYIDALHALIISADETMIYNPTAIDVWVTANGETVKISAGQQVNLK